MVALELNELIAVLEGASNHLIAVEERDEDDLRILRRHYARLVELVEQQGSSGDAHSIDEAEGRAAEMASAHDR